MATVSYKDAIKSVDQAKKAYESAKASGASKSALDAIHARADEIRGYKTTSDGSKPLSSGGSNKSVSTGGAKKETVSYNGQNYIIDTSGGYNSMDTKSAVTKTLDDAEQNKRMAQERFDSYMKNFNPGMSQDEFVSKAMDTGNAAASLKYDATIADLKKRVANIIANNQTQLQNLDNTYKPAYENNQQDAYDSKENVRRILAKRGMLGSGIQIGAEQQADNVADKARQNIDLSKASTTNELNSAITGANNDFETDLASLEAQKNDYLAQVRAQAAQDYQTYVDKQKQTATDNFYKNLNYESNQDALKQGLLGTLSQYDLGLKGINSSDTQAANKLKFDYANLKATQEQAAKELGFKYTELDSKNQQFDKSLGLETQKLREQTKLGYAELANKMETARLDFGIAKQKLGMEMKQYDLALKELTAKTNAQDKEIYVAENSRVDSAIGKLLEMAEADVVDRTKAGQTLASIIYSSGLTDAMKAEKKKMIEEVFGLGTSGSSVTVGNDSTSGGYYDDTLRQLGIGY